MKPEGCKCRKYTMTGLPGATNESRTMENGLPQHVKVVVGVGVELTIPVPDLHPHST
jgi:hypothetical protein